MRSSAVRPKKKRRPAPRRTQAPPAPAGTPPWSPLALFLLTAVPWIAVIPFGFPALLVGAGFCAWNWRRLGRPERSWEPLAVALVLLSLPFLVYGLRKSGLQAGHIVLFQAAAILSPMFNLYSQKEAYNAHVGAGGETTTTTYYWLVNLPLGILALFVWAAWMSTLAR